MKSGEKHSIELDLPGLGHRRDHRIDVGVGEAAEEPVVVLEPFAAERRARIGSTTT